MDHDSIAYLGDALQCHQCTSYTHSMCADPFYNENEDGTKTPKTDEFLQECPNDGNEYTLCRKIYQNGKSNIVYNYTMSDSIAG